MSNVYISGRVSHESSGLSGLSEANQYQVCRDYIASVLPHLSFGKVPTDCYPEGNLPGYYFDRARSAWRRSFDARPGTFALSKVLKPGDHIVMYSIDRGFRSVKAFCNQMDAWHAQNITPHFVTENINFGTASGKAMGQMLATLAEYYSNLLSERTKEALRIRKLLKRSDTAKQDKPHWVGSGFQFTPSIEPKKEPGIIYQYARCSHYDSALSGLGMESQLEGNRRFAERLAMSRPWLTVSHEEFRDDSVSAFRVPFAERPAGRRLINIIRPNDAIVGYRLDRMFRTPHDAAKISADLAKQNIGIHLVDDGIDTLSGYGQMFLNVLSVFAYIESSIKSKRNSECVARCKATGRPYARPPIHSKIVYDKATHTKKLAFDFDKTADMAAAYLCRRALGLTCRQTSDVMHAIECSRTFTMPRPFAFRETWGHNQVNEHSAHFKKLMDTMPPSAIEECIEKATTLLETRINDCFLKHVTTQFPLPQTRQCIEDHLAAV